jgi:hypothetical protein
MLLVTHAVLVWQSRPPAIETASNDDAEYLLLSRSLRSFHYQDQHLLGSPVHALYPPAYPALLGVSTATLGDRLEVVQVVTLLCSVLALLLIFDIARRLTTPLVALLLLAPLAFNAHLVGYAGRIASEMPYMMFSFATLWVAVAFPDSRRWIYWAGALAILAALTRSIGVSLVLAFPVFLLLRRRYKAALGFVTIAALTVGLWFAWTLLPSNQFNARSYVAVAANTTRAQPSVADLVAVRTVKFVKMYVAKSFPAGLEVPSVPGTWIDNAVWVLAILGLGGVGLWSVRKRAPLLPVYVAFFLGLLWLYPFKLTRFYMPVAPLLLLSMFLGAIALTRRWRPIVGAAVISMISAAILLRSVPRALEMASSRARCDRSAPFTSQECFRPETVAFIAAAQRAREVLPSNAVVLTIKEAAFHYYTGLKVYHMLVGSRNSGDDPLSYLNRVGIEYVLISAYVGGAKYLSHLVPHCRNIEVLVRLEPRTALLKVHPKPVVPEDRNACPLNSWEDSALAEAVPPVH